MAPNVRIGQPLSNRVTVGMFAVASSVPLIVILIIRVPPNPLSLAVIAVVAAVAVYAYRLLRVQVLADANGLVIRNFLSTSRYEWSDVVDFTLGATAVGKGITAVLSNADAKALEASIRSMVARARSPRCRERRSMQRTAHSPPGGPRAGRSTLGCGG